MSETIEERRRRFMTAGLNRDDLAPDPAAQCERWYQQAEDAELLQPNAMSLATATADGVVSARLVLLRSFDAGGFVFFSGAKTQKAAAIAENPRVALLFSWLELNRQIRIQGTAVSLSTAATLRYFLGRGRGSQIGAWLNQSSDVIGSRQLLRAKLAQIKEQFRDGQIPLPDAWGGYRVIPSRFEFWQGRPNGLHDRWRYRREEEEEWVIERLMP